MSCAMITDGYFLLQLYLSLFEFGFHFGYSVYNCTFPYWNFDSLFRKYVTVRCFAFVVLTFECILWILSVCS